MADYNFSEIEPKWQKFWKENNTYKVVDNFAKPKYYILDMFPYPSAAGLHIGHPEGYTASDIVARYKRMKGYNVLHPMGFDAFGLPTERYCMQTGIHPTKATADNVTNYIRQLSAIGFGYDWDRMVNTTKPQYYKWTQWMFSLIYNSWYDHQLKKARHINELPIPKSLTSAQEIEDYKDSKRLAFIANIPVNWCEGLGTVLANEEVEEWKNKGYKVERKPMRQWMLRITEYADRLLEDLELVEWPNSTKEMQKNWIGKSIGAEISFSIENTTDNIKVFTTRPDTIFGATYMVLAPEHALVEKITTNEQRVNIEKYVTDATTKSDLERTELNKNKTGVWTGAFAINPASQTRIPIWIADYVLAHYGTGAIMAVPGHDDRDYEFAKEYNLEIKQVVTNKDDNVNIEKEAFCEKTGFAINSANNELNLNGLETPAAIQQAIEWLQKKGLGEGKVQFKLRDWLFSRQRYWGEPMPIIYYKDGTKRCMELDELPLVLPSNVTDFQPAATGESPLAKVPEWINFIDKKTGKQGSLETNTMPQWAGSCWYYLRYIDPHNDSFFVDKDKEKYWMNGGVDLYIGGAEHAVLHLLYARFWHKVLFDYGHVSYPEPFKKLFHQGLIIGEDGRKMSKSLGNVINPDEVVKEFGADALRMFEMFLGPLEAAKPWSKTGIEGVFRFLNRVWRLIANEDGTLSPNVKATADLTEDQAYTLNFTIKKIAEDIENLSFNTAVSQMMIFVNEFNKAEVKSQIALEKFVICLSTFAPHISEELWHVLGHNDSVVLQPYPNYDESKLSRKEVEFVVQVGSKIRGKINLPLDTEQTAAESMAKGDANVSKFLAGQTVKKVVFVKNKLINFIV